MRQTKKPHKARRSRYEGSPADRRADKRGAKSAGMSLKQYEGSPADQAADAAAVGGGGPMPGPNEFSPTQERAMRMGGGGGMAPDTDTEPV